MDATCLRSEYAGDDLNFDLESSVEQAAKTARNENVSHGIATGYDTMHT